MPWAEARGQTRSDFVRAGAIGILGLLLAGGAGCSRGERVRVVNRYGQAVRVRLERFGLTTPLLANGGEFTLPEKRYVGGGGVAVTVLSERGDVLRSGIVEVPGDSMTRDIALIEVRP